MGDNFGHRKVSLDIVMISNDLDPNTITTDPIILPVLARAAELAGLSFDELSEGLIEQRTSDGSEQVLLLSNYFRLLHRFAEKSNDETLAMSDRPLLAGAFHYVLQQAAKLKDFEALLQHFAHSFNMLHGGTYNHVFFRDDKIVYSIDVDGFPYPFKLSPHERGTLIDCILILVHIIFVLCAGERITHAISAVRTGSQFSKLRAPPHQLSFWPCQVVPDNHVFELEYRLDATRLPIDPALEKLPSEFDIYLTIAKYIEQHDTPGPARQSIVERVAGLIVNDALSEAEVARELELSVRTLRRQLGNSGVSFQALRAQELNKRAKRLLRQNYRIEEVAERLRYSDARSFRRAFVRWNKMTPREYCERAKES